MLKKETIVFTQDKIVDASTLLFYEFGYNSTSFRNIAEVCDITKGLITYHFESKANLAKEVIYNYNIQIKKTVEDTLAALNEPNDALINMVIEAHILNEMYHIDEKAKRFSLEYLDSGFGNQYNDEFAGFYKIINRQYQFDRSDAEYKMICTSQMFTALSLSYSFFRGDIDCTFEEYVEFSMKLQLKILGLSEEKAESIYQQGMHLLPKIGYDIMPYFQVVS